VFISDWAWIWLCYSVKNCYIPLFEEYDTIYVHKISFWEMLQSAALPAAALTRLLLWAKILLEVDVGSKGCLRQRTTMTYIRLRSLLPEINSLQLDLTALRPPMCIVSALSSPQTIPQLSTCPYTCHCSTPAVVEVSLPHCTAASPRLCHC